MSPRATRPATVPTTTGLRDRLTFHAPTDAAVLRRLFERRRRWTIASATSTFWLEFEHAGGRGNHGERVGIVIDGRPAELVLSSPAPGAIGELDWSDYVGNARLTAWTLAHRRPMTRLARVLSSIVLPQSLVDGSASVPAGLSALAFRIEDGEGAADHGVLHVETTVIDRLLARADREPVSRSAVRVACDALPVPVRVSASGPQLVARELRELERGDVLVLGERKRAFAQLTVAVDGAHGADRWTATWAGASVRIDARAAALIDPDWSTPMNEPAERLDATVEPPTGAEPPAVAPPLADPLAQLPLRIDFVLGETSIPLARLAQFEPGYLFELAAPLDNARVGIRANGRTIGSGRLVAIGDTLGVQLEGWELDGLQ